MFNKLDHIAIAVDSIDRGVAFYRDVAGLGEPVRVDMPELQIRCAFFDPGSDGTILELVEISGRSDLVHGDVVVALEVADLDGAIRHFRENGVKAHDQAPTDNLPLRRGWVLKQDGHGTVVELCLPGQVAKFVRGHAVSVRG